MQIFNFVFILWFFLREIGEEHQDTIANFSYRLEISADQNYSKYQFTDVLALKIVQFLSFSLILFNSEYGFKHMQLKLKAFPNHRALKSNFSFIYGSQISIIEFFLWFDFERPDTNWSFFQLYDESFLKLSLAPLWQNVRSCPLRTKIPRFLVFDRSRGIKRGLLHHSFNVRKM